MITIEIETDSDSFGETENQKAFELSMILQRLSRTLERHGEIREQKIFDYNGNAVGRLTK